MGDLHKWANEERLCALVVALDQLQPQVSGIIAAGGTRAPVDFGIVTALDCERDAVVRLLQNPRLHPPDGTDIRYYYSGSVQTKTGGRFNIAVVRSQDTGNASAQAAASDLINRWSPGRLIVFGVAGGFQREGLKRGDVVVADEVYPYEYVKLLAEGRTERENRAFRTDPTVLSHVREARATWRNSEKSPSVLIGGVAAGDKVYADREARDRLLAIDRKLLAVEMESEGVATCAWERKPPVPVSVIRGICDMADEETKGEQAAERGKDMWQRYAADSAADFLAHLLNWILTTSADVKRL